ncbi:MAG: dipeptide epimerase [Gloeomargaritaceae cyanobacterium C42_A2020_066]|nr:dipeptide epimerase [Gloeomargaritaceae cyanobacterium C42_A2020_066]
MEVRVEPFMVTKRVPLTISRGTTATSTNLWVRVCHEGLEGWGEASPFSTGFYPRQTLGDLRKALESAAGRLANLTPWDRQAIATQTHDLPSAGRAALDMACWDWVGKAVGQPLWRLWGLAREEIPVTTVTIGILEPEAAAQRVQQWFEQIEVQALKVKLGSPAGREADQAMLTAVLAARPRPVPVSVDANGGWDLATARWMAAWLAERGIGSLEQPLAAGREAELPQLCRDCPLPVFVDESCWTSEDVIQLAALGIAGVNLKLMKCGGLITGLGLIHTARTLNLHVMIGCYSDSALANTAASHLTPLVDAVDLDSHLNLQDDPFQGATLAAGRLLPSDQPGLGVSHAHP